MMNMRLATSWKFQIFDIPWDLPRLVTAQYGNFRTGREQGQNIDKKPPQRKVRRDEPAWSIANKDLFKSTAQANCG